MSLDIFQFLSIASQFRGNKLLLHRLGNKQGNKLHKQTSFFKFSEHTTYIFNLEDNVFLYSVVQCRQKCISKRQHFSYRFKTNPEICSQERKRQPEDSSGKLFSKYTLYHSNVSEMRSILNLLNLLNLGSKIRTARKSRHITGVVAKTSNNW